MTHENKKLRRWFATRPCEICPYLGLSCRAACDPFHIIAAGADGGSRLDVRYNLLSSCRWTHTLHHDGNLKFQGKRLRQEELFGLVVVREDLDDEVDLRQTLWCILNMPKDASVAQMSRSVALLPLHDRKVCWDVLREMEKVP